MNFKLYFMKHVFLLFGLTFCISLSFGQDAPKNSKARPFDKNGIGANLQVPNSDAVAPKPDRTRSQCCLNFDNYTGLYLNIWVDDTYRGQVSPYEEGHVCVYGGWTSYYVRSAGGSYEWSDSGSCNEWTTLRMD